MTWTDFYLVCFLVGFILSAVSFLFGSAHLHFPHHGGGGHVHLGHGHAHATRIGHAHSGPGHGPVVFQLRHGDGVSGLVRRHGISADALLVAVGLAGRWCSRCVSGLTGAAMVFWFVAKC